MALITETNQQYYQGAQPFLVTNAAGQSSFVTNFNTDLVFGDYDPTATNYALNNFKLYTSSTGLPGSFTEYILKFEVENNISHFNLSPKIRKFVLVSLVPGLIFVSYSIYNKINGIPVPKNGPIVDTFLVLVIVPLIIALLIHEYCLFKKYGQ